MRGVVEGDVRPAFAHAVNDLDVRHALFPIPTQVVIIDVKNIFARMAIADAVGEVGDAIRGRVHRGRGFERGAGIEERDDANTRIRLGRNAGVNSKALTAGSERDDGQEISLAGNQAGDDGRVHVSDVR